MSPRKVAAPTGAALAGSVSRLVGRLSDEEYAVFREAVAALLMREDVIRAKVRQGSESEPGSAYCDYCRKVTPTGTGKAGNTYCTVCTPSWVANDEDPPEDPDDKVVRLEDGDYFHPRSASEETLRRWCPVWQGMRDYRSDACPKCGVLG